MLSNFLPRLAFVLACAFFAFLYGFAASRFGWFPSEFLDEAFAQAESVKEQVELAGHHLSPARHDLTGVETYGEADTSRGVTLLTGFWLDDGGTPGIRLIDPAGEFIHAWDVDPHEIWPDPPHEDGLKGVFHASPYIHGTYLFENGDVLFNVEYVGLARVDAHGDVVWKLDERTHHSVHRTDDGDFWVCATHWHDDPAEVARRFPQLLPPLGEDLIVRVSAGGEVLERVSMVEVVMSHPELARQVWKVRSSRMMDLLHLNDVEPLPASLADEYPLFDAGDVVVSLRELDLVFVLDPETKQIKWWWDDAPIVRQHDPDFIGDGWISVYDNATDGSLDGAFLGGTRLLAVRPHTGEVRQIYPVDGAPHGHERRFYSATGGKAQLLPNDHWLITEAQFGRVFEIDEQGRTVWEWGHERRENDLAVSEVLEGTRYPFSIATVRGWTAPR